MAQGESFSIKALNEMLLPKVGDIVEDSRVVYVKVGKLMFSAEPNRGAGLPMIDYTFTHNGMIYKVNFINEEKRRWNATFVGFSSMRVPEIPDIPDIQTIDNGVEKII